MPRRRLLALTTASIVIACGGDDKSGSGGSGGSGVPSDASGGSSTGGSAGSAGGDASGTGGGAGSSGGMGTGGASGASGNSASGGTSGAAGADAGSVGTPPNVAFVTSTSYLPSALGGLDGADAKCQAQANAAGLPGNFVAWLSDTNEDAVTRLGSARGWARPDGRPFVDSIADLLALRHLYPLHLNETGARIVVPGVVTGTTQDGLRAPATGDFCQDWTGDNASVGIVGGDPDSFGANWTGASANPAFLMSCASEAHLYCFQIDHSEPLDLDFPPSRRVFVSNGVTGITGLGAFDQQCADEAEAGSIPGTFKAFVATGGASAISRFDASGDPWGRADGVLLMDTAAEIGAATQLLAPIVEFADGTFVWERSGGELVYSGALTPSTPGVSGETCGGNWSSLAGQHTFGFAGVSTKEWWNDERYPSPAGCNTYRHLYCFEE